MHQLPYLLATSILYPPVSTNESMIILAHGMKTDETGRSSGEGWGMIGKMSIAPCAQANLTLLNGGQYVAAKWGVGSLGSPSSPAFSYNSMMQLCCLTQQARNECPSSATADG